MASKRGTSVSRKSSTSGAPSGGLPPAGSLLSAEPDEHEHDGGAAPPPAISGSAPSSGSILAGSAPLGVGSAISDVPQAEALGALLAQLLKAAAVSTAPATTSPRFSPGELKLIEDTLKLPQHQLPTEVNQPNVASWAKTLHDACTTYSSIRLGDAPAGMLNTTIFATTADAWRRAIIRRVCDTDSLGNMPDISLQRFFDLAYARYKQNLPPLLEKLRALPPVPFYSSREANFQQVDLLRAHIATLTASCATPSTHENFVLLRAVQSLVPPAVRDFVDRLTFERVRHSTYTALLDLLAAICSCKRDEGAHYHCAETLATHTYALADGTTFAIQLSDYKHSTELRDVFGSTEVPTTDFPWWNPDHNPAPPQSSASTRAPTTQHTTSGGGAASSGTTPAPAAPPSAPAYVDPRPSHGGACLGRRDPGGLAAALRVAGQPHWAALLRLQQQALHPLAMPLQPRQQRRRRVRCRRFLP